MKKYKSYLSLLTLFIIPICEVKADTITVFDPKDHCNPLMNSGHFWGCRASSFSTALPKLSSTDAAIIGSINTILTLAKVYLEYSFLCPSNPQLSGTFVVGDKKFTALSDGNGDKKIIETNIEYGKIDSLKFQTEAAGFVSVSNKCRLIISNITSLPLIDFENEIKNRSDSIALMDMAIDASKSVLEWRSIYAIVNEISESFYNKLASETLQNISQKQAEINSMLQSFIQADNVCFWDEGDKQICLTDEERNLLSNLKTAISVVSIPSVPK